MKRIFVLIGCFFSLQLMGQPLERIIPEQAGIDFRRLHFADDAILQAIANGEIPGAVLAVVHKGKMANLKAYGNKQVYPSVLPMEVNTVFDMASVSKSISTAISVMILVERGKLLLTDQASMYIPEFQGNIRIIDLLTHTSGLPVTVTVDSLSSESLNNYISVCRRFVIH